jgi:iron complex outermembrane recepter protein
MTRSAIHTDRRRNDEGLREKLRRSATGVVTLLALAILRGTLAATPAPPREPPLRIDLPPSSLQQALASLADRAGWQILYDPDLIQGLTVGGLHGVMTPGEALRRLLVSTPISFEFTATDAIALHADDAPETHSAPTPASPHTVTIIANRDREVADDSSVNLTSVKIEESSLLVPVATSSLTQSFIRDQQATRLEDALEYVSATEIAPDDRSSVGFGIRGFPTYQYYLDGVRISPDLHGDGFRDLADVDHVDILKGPASLLFGRSEPGGIINVVTKQPLASPMLSIEQRFGSFGRADTLLDAGGPLNPADSLLYRFNAAWENDGSFREVPGSRRVFFAPVLTWRPAPGSATTAYLEYLNSHDPSDSGFPVVGHRIPDIPIDRSLDEGGEVHTTDLRTGIRGSYTFRSGWTLRHHVDARWLRTPQAPQIAVASDGLSSNQCDTTHCTVERTLLAIPVARGYTGYASVELARDLPLWGTTHSLLVGAEYFQTSSYSDLQTVSDASLTTDLFHPSSIAIPLALLQEPTEEVHRDAREHWGAAYMQDQVTFTDDFYLLVGARVDGASASIEQATSESLIGVRSAYFQASNLKTRKFKHREGFVWHPIPSLSFYTLHTESFGIAPGLYAGTDGYSGNDQPQQSATEWEAGVKFELEGGPLAATLAAFNLTKEHVSSTILEPALDPSGELIYTGSVRNRGLELDVHGELLPRLEYLANFAYIDSRIIFDGASQTNFPGGEWIGGTGNRFFGVPREGGSAWLAYRFSDRAFQGLKLGAGVIARGAREGDNSNDYELPGFTKWSGLAAYGWRAGTMQISLRLNVDNLFNTRYYESLNGTRTVMPAYPRRWIASFRLQF